MIYLIHGADSFRAREKLNELVSEFKKKGQNAANLDVFDIEEENIVNKLKAAAQTLGFLSPARMIIVKNLFSEGGVEAKKGIADFVLNMGKKNGLTRSINSGQASSPHGGGPDFIFFEGKEIGKKGAAGGKEWAALSKHGTFFLFLPLSPAELRKWAMSRFAAVGTKITPAALDKLTLYAGDDLWRLSLEIEKLSLLKLVPYKKNSEKEQILAACGEQDRAVSEEDIEAMVKSDFSTSIFSTVDALARRDKKAALKLLAGHLEKGEAPIYLFSMFAYQISNLIKVKNVFARESALGKSATSDEISRILKMHPYVVKKTIPYAAKFSFDYLKKLHKRLLRFDFLIKKGRLDAETALEMIVIEVGNLT